jgi:citrate lyase subunit beta/citryl-CoA lyase
MEATDMTIASWRLRSLLFVPGDRPSLVAKAVAAGPDAIIVDLEDAVSAQHLDDARAAAAAELRRVEGGPTRRIVRVHAATHPAMHDDIDAVVGPWLHGIMLAKVDGPEDVEAADAAIATREHAVGLPSGSVALLPLVESCQGLRTVYEIARASTRMVAMVFSSGEEGDFMADLGGRWTPDGLALQYPRSRFLCDVRAAGDALVIDGVCMQLERPDIVTSESRIAQVMGFDGKLAIHPRQIDAIHEVFTPSPDEVAAARGMLESFEAGAAEGKAVVTHEGRMVDPANARVARRILARAGVSTAAAQ